MREKILNQLEIALEVTWGDSQHEVTILNMAQELKDILNLDYYDNGEIRIKINYTKDIECLWEFTN